MSELLRLETLADVFRHNPVSTFFLLLTLMTILMMIVLRWWVRRKLRAMLEEKGAEEEELDALPVPTPQDQRALEIIKDFRSKVWDLPDDALELSIEGFNQRGAEIVRAIAAVYHSDAEVPQYEASLLELLNMVRRVSTRLGRLASTVPFKFLGNRRLSDYQRYYQVYRKVTENPVLDFFKRNRHLYRAAKFAMDIKNIANPVYWAGKELSREGYFYMIRWFHMTFISQVGREAMRLYSGRHFQAEEDRDAALACYRLFALMRQWGGPSAAEWTVFIDFVSGQSALDADSKIHVLSQCAQDRLPKDLEVQRFETKAGIKGARQGLKRILDADAAPLPIKASLIEAELKGLDAPADKGPVEPETVPNSK